MTTPHSILRALTAGDLTALSKGILSGRLTSFSVMSLERHVSRAVAAAVASELQARLDAGVGVEGLAFALQLLAEEKAAHGDPVVDLVLTGPEVSSVASRDTAVVVPELFRAARRSVVVAGFAVHRGEQVFRELARRMEEVPELSVRLYLNVARKFKDTTIASDLARKFRKDFAEKQWPAGRLPEIFYDHRSLAQAVEERASLHAKCVVIDDEVGFVSSANFTEAAQKKNIEVGVLLREPSLARQLARHFEGLVEAGVLVRL